MESYFAVRRKPKRQTATVISLWFCGLLACPEQVIGIGHYAINIPKIYQLFTVF